MMPTLPCSTVIADAEVRVIVDDDVVVQRALIDRLKVLNVPGKPLQVRVLDDKQEFRQLLFLDDEDELQRAFKRAQSRLEDQHLRRPWAHDSQVQLLFLDDDKKEILGKAIKEHLPACPDDQEELREDPQPERAVFAEEKLRLDELPPPLLEDLHHLLQTHFPVLYAQVLEPTLADLRHEHSTALAAGHRMEARCILLRGCGALAAAAVCQLGVSLLGRIASLWQAKSSK